MASYPARPATGNRAVGAPLELRSAFCRRPAHNPLPPGCNTTTMPCRCPLAPCPQQFCHGWRYGRGRAHCERVHAPWWILHKIKKGVAVPAPLLFRLCCLNTRGLLLRLPLLGWPVPWRPQPPCHHSRGANCGGTAARHWRPCRCCPGSSNMVQTRPLNLLHTRTGSVLSSWGKLCLPRCCGHGRALDGRRSHLRQLGKRAEGGCLQSTHLLGCRDPLCQPSNWLAVVLGLRWRCRVRRLRQIIQPAMPLGNLIVTRCQAGLRS